MKHVKNAIIGLAISSLAIACAVKHITKTDTSSPAQTENSAVNTAPAGTPATDATTDSSENLTLSGNGKGLHLRYAISSDIQSISGYFQLYLCTTGVRITTEMNMPQLPGHTIDQTSFINNDQPDVAVSLNPKNKTYTRLIINETADTDDKDDYKITKIGEEMMDGFHCVHVKVDEDGGDSYELWNTKDVQTSDLFAKLMKSNGQMGPDGMDKALNDAGCGGIIVKMITLSSDNDRIVMDLKEAERMDPPSSYFVIPDGYTETKKISF